MNQIRFTRQMPTRSPNWIDFRNARQSVSLEALLSRYGVQMHPSGRNTLRGQCPLPSHDPTKKTPSFIVNTTKNVWSCHSQSCAKGRGGKIGGNALDFVAAMEVRFSNGPLWIQPVIHGETGGASSCITPLIKTL